MLGLAAKQFDLRAPRDQVDAGQSRPCESCGASVCLVELMHCRELRSRLAPSGFAPKWASPESKRLGAPDSPAVNHRLHYMGP